MKTKIQSQTKKRIVLTSLVVSISLLTFSYYIYLSQYQEGILPPLSKSTSIVYKSFDASKGVVFHQPTGTHIVIPGDALVDENGKKIKGKVTLKFREFQNAREIFLSGIPMQFGDDRTDYFSSGGMMELRVFQNKKPVKLMKGKKVEVELASAITPTAEYKLFKLNNDESWDTGAAFATTKNVRRDSALAALPDLPALPVNPLTDTAKFVFELVSDLKRMPHLKIWENVKWKFINSDDELLPQEALRISWDKITIDRLTDNNNSFKLTFSLSVPNNLRQAINSSYTMIASPVLKGKELAKAIGRYNEDLAAYKIEFAEIDKEEDRLLLEAGVLNIFQMNEFGICNIDCFASTSILAKVDLQFDFEKDLNPELNKVMLYVVLEKKRSVIRFNAFDWDEIPLTDSPCELIAVLPNGKVAYVSKEEFSKTITTSGLKRGNSFFFKTNKKDFDEMASILTTPVDQSRFN